MSWTLLLVRWGAVGGARSGVRRVVGGSIWRGDVGSVPLLFLSSDANPAYSQARSRTSLFHQAPTEEQYQETGTRRFQTRSTAHCGGAGHVWWRRLEQADGEDVPLLVSSLFLGADEKPRIGSFENPPSTERAPPGRRGDNTKDDGRGILIVILIMRSGSPCKLEVKMDVSAMRRFSQR